MISNLTNGGWMYIAIFILLTISIIGWIKILGIIIAFRNKEELRSEVMTMIPFVNRNPLSFNVTLDQVYDDPKSVLETTEGKVMLICRCLKERNDVLVHKSDLCDDNKLHAYVAHVYRQTLPLLVANS